MKHRHVVLRIASAIALAGVLVISPPIKVPTASALTVFSDDFSSADFTNWTAVTGLSIDPGVGRVAPPSAKAQSVAAPAFASKQLPTTLGTVCMSMNVNATSLDASTSVLLRLRTSANGPIIRVFALTGILRLRSDVSAAQRSSGVALGTGWHSIELCGTVGTSGSWDLYRDGVEIVSDWVANTGTTPVGRVEIGDNGAKTYTVNFDDVVVTDAHANADADPPTTPGQPTGSSPTVGGVTISWAASQDAAPPITYRIYRDGNQTPIADTRSTSFTDVGLAPYSSHTYAVDAIDSLNNPPSPKSPSSDPIIVSATAPIFTDDFSSAGFTNWTGVTGLSIDPGAGRVAPPSAKAQSVAAPAFASKQLPTTLGTVCMSMNVNATSLDASTSVLLRLRTSANGPIIRVFALTGILRLRSDVSAAQRSSGVALGTGWHSIELCGAVGTSGSWDLYRDGVEIVSDWVANTGTTPVGRVEIGDNGAKTYTVNFDDVVVTGPSVVQPTAPNILIFLTDDQRASDTVIPNRDAEAAPVAHDGRSGVHELLRLYPALLPRSIRDPVGSLRA